MGNTFISVGSDDDDQSLERMKNAAAALDTAHYSAVAKAGDITKSEYRARQSKDYLTPQEVFENEKFRISDSYGIDVTPELVELDNGGRLIRAIASLEAILSKPEGVIIDHSTSSSLALASPIPLIEHPAGVYLATLSPGSPPYNDYHFY